MSSSSQILNSHALRQAAALGKEASPLYDPLAPLNRLDLRKLRHAAVLAVEGNFTRAAEKLHITPSALSQSIARLEQDLGLLLFDRNPGGVTVSRIGRQFIDRIDRLLSDARGLAHDLAQASDPRSGQVVFGLRPNAARMVLNPLMRRLLIDAPGLQTVVAITVNEVLVEYILLEQLEFLICDADVGALNERLISTRLVDFAMGHFARPGHPLAERGVVSPADLRAFPLASTVLTNQSLDQERAWLEMAPADTFPAAFWCDDYTYLLDAVLHSDAILLAPVPAVASEVEAGAIVPIRPAQAPASYQSSLHLITLDNRSLSPAARDVIERIEAILGDGAAGLPPAAVSP